MSYHGLWREAADSTAECWRRTRKGQFWEVLFLFEVFIIIWGQNGERKGERDVSLCKVFSGNIPTKTMMGTGG